MAFFGSADSDSLVKQLRGQLAQKDFEIQTLINEQTKKDELWSETKRAKDDALYKAQTEQERAMKAERTLAKSIADLQNANMRLANLESTLNDANVRHKKDEKEIDRLQYELDTRADAAAANNRVQNTVNGLQDEVKSLKNQLQRTQSEKETLENQARLSGGGGIFAAGGFGGGHGGNGKEKATILALENEMQALKRENLKLMEQDRCNASSSTPVRPRTQNSFHPSPTPRSKRALSFSGGASHPKIQALEAEIEHLRSQAMPGLDMKEVEKLRTDVETAKRHALKMENEKMAAERSIQREMEDIRSRLSDANDELQYLRALDGQSVQQELQNAKKDAQKERSSLQQELKSRSDDLERRKMDVLRLESRLSEVQEEVNQLRSKASVAVHPEEDVIRGLRESVDKLKQELETRTTAYEEAKKQIECLEDKLKAASKPVSDNMPTNAQAAKLQRAHQREIEDLQQAKDTLRRHLADSEELVAERDAEIFELKRHMPLPSSSADASFHEVSAVDTEKLQQQLIAKAEQLEEAHQAKAIIEDRLQRVETELKHALATATSKDFELDKLREQLESTLSETEQKRHVLTEQLEAEEQKCRVYKKQLEEQEVTRRNLIDKLAALQEEQRLASANIDKAASDQQQIDKLKGRIVELEEQAKSIDALQNKITQGERCLDELRVEKAAVEGELAVAKRALSDIRAELDETSASARRLQEEQQTLIAGHRQEMESRSAAQKADMAELQSQLDVMRDQVEESDAELFQLQEELAKATSSQVEKGAPKVASAQSDRLQVELDHAIQQTVNLDAQVRSLTSTIESLNDDLEESQRLLQFADVEHGILAQAVSAANTAEQISEAQMNRLRKELEEAESALSEEREATSTERQESQEMITRLRDDFAALQLEHEDLVDSKTQLETALETATSEIQRKENDLQSARDQLNSITANSTDGAVIELRRHVQELEARVARRNQLVAVEQAKTKKVEMNLEMATQDIEELEAEISRLREEISAKEAVAHEKDAETAESREESSKQLDQLEQELVQCRRVEETLRSEVQERSVDLAKVVEQLARSENDRQTEGLRATELREGLERDHLAKVDSITREVQQQCERFEIELKSTWSDLQDATGTINSMTVQLVLWSREMRSLESSRDQARRGAEVEASRNGDLRSKLETALAQVETVSSQLSVKEDNLRQALQHAEVEASRNTSLRSEMKEAMAQAKATSEQVRVKEAELQKALNDLTRDMEDSRGEATQQIILLRERVKELEEQLRSTSTSLEQQADTASLAQEDLVSVKAELTRLENVNATHTSERLQETEAHTREVASIREDCERLSHSLAQATSDLEKSDASYQETKKALESLNRELDASARQVINITIERDNALEMSATLQQEIAQLSTRCSDADAKEESATVRVAALENQLSREMEQIGQLRTAQAQAETRLQQLLKQVDTQQSANEQLNRSLAEHSRDRFQIAAERDELIRDRQSVDDQLAEEQSVAQQLRRDLESAVSETMRLQAELQAKSEEASAINARYQKAHGLASALTSDASRLESKLQEASKKLAATEDAIAKLTAEKASLASTSQTQLDDVNRLEQSLEGMQTDLEEQMAQVRNANKAKAQLQRRVDKLERKLKSMSDVPAAADVPVPASVLAPQPIVYNQEAVRMSPGALAGQKRVRDDDLAVKKISAGPEAVVAPSPFEMARTPVKRMEAGANRLAFTPTRHNLNPNLGAIPRSPYARLATGDENSFPAMAMMRGRIGSVLNQHTPGQ